MNGPQWAYPLPDGSAWNSSIRAKILRRKALKRGLEIAPVPMPLDCHSRPDLRLGMFEIFRAKEFNPLGAHFGVLIRTLAGIFVYDLQNDEGPRQAISFEKYALGKQVYITRFIPPGPEMQAALKRLEEAVNQLSDWTLFENNCEHWAKYVVRGERTSGQSNGVKAIAAIAGIAILFG